MARKLKGTITINRKKWLTGEIDSTKTGIYSSLLNERSGLMCCLGQAALQLGCTREDILGQGMPDDIVPDLVMTGARRDVISRRQAALRSAGLVRGRICTRTAASLAFINDSDNLTREERERKVAAKFRRIGWGVKFVGKYPDYENLTPRG